MDNCSNGFLIFFYMFFYQMVSTFFNVHGNMKMTVEPDHNHRPIDMPVTCSKIRNPLYGLHSEKVWTYLEYTNPY